MMKKGTMVFSGSEVQVKNQSVDDSIYTVCVV